MENVSVILTSFNYDNYLEQAIESILAQTIQPEEIIVIDDGSEDKSLSILEKYHQKYPKLFHLLARPSCSHNKGIFESVMEAVRYASSPWVAFLEADDWWEPTHLETTLLPAIRNDNLVLSFSASDFEYQDASEWCEGFSRKVISKDLIHNNAFRVNSLIDGNFINSFSCAIARRDEVCKIPNLNSKEFDHWADWWMWNFMSQKGEFLYSGRSTCHTRIHQKSFTAKSLALMEHQIDKEIRFKSHVQDHLKALACLN